MNKDHHKSKIDVGSWVEHTTYFPVFRAKVIKVSNKYIGLKNINNGRCYWNPNNFKIVPTEDFISEVFESLEIE